VKINIVFDGPPTIKAGRFVEVEDLEGNGIGVGEWFPYSGPAGILPVEGWWMLQLEVPDETVRR
jgi:hypothetical protein